METNWGLIAEAKAIFEKLLDYPPASRDAAARELCDSNAELRAEVEALLESAAVSDSFLEVSLPELLRPAAPSPMTGRKIGAFEIVRQIGHGGMSAVYLARRTDGFYTQDVALKIIDRGHSSVEIQERFRREVAVLSKLVHPNIVRLFDVGTTDDGLLYIVMEYVDGLSLDVYCREGNLPPAECLLLFQAICDAVSFAHSKLVVHRDLKPSNILVTKEGIPKLLDFGIAKLLDAESGDTSAGFNRMTLEYASPEQVRGESVSTASDTYSLGVILFELIAGKLPYKFRGSMPHNVARAIIEDEALSAATEGVSRELDAILMMALQKEPARRYASVRRLQEDLQRYIGGLPVYAHHGGAFYQLSKFVRRNRFAFVAGAIFVLLIVTGALTTWLYARRSQKHLQQTLQIAAQVMAQMEIEASYPGEMEAVLPLARTARTALLDLASENQGNVEILGMLLTVTTELGELEGHPSVQNLGDTARSVQTLRAAVQIGEGLFAQDPMNTTHAVDLTRALNALGSVRLETDEYKEAALAFERARALNEHIQPDDRGYNLRRQAYAVTLMNLSRIRSHEDDLIGCLNLIGQSVAIRRKVASLEPAFRGHSLSLAGNLTSYGEALGDAGKYSEAFSAHAESNQILSRLVSTWPDRIDLPRMQADNYLHIGRLDLETSRPRQAASSIGEACALYRSVMQANGKDPISRRRLAEALSWLVLARGQIAAPLASLGEEAREAVALAKSAADSDPRNRRSQAMLNEVQSRVRAWR